MPQNTIIVRVGKLMQALKKYEITDGMTLEEFAHKYNFALDTDVRVNGEVPKSGYVLREGDIITVVADIAGGV